jgi:hypothetical protein
MIDDLHDKNLYPPEVDSRHYFFERHSGLPRGYFDRWRPTQEQVAFWGCVVAAIVVIIWGV